MKENNRVAVFIDAENIPSKYADRILKEASNYGDVIIKRVFADWSKTNLNSWKDIALSFSIIAEHQFVAVEKRDSSDILLIINVMNVLFEKEIDVFCLASSDSDFARLVQELRERGKMVVGFGEKKTPKPFVSSFSEFVYLDLKEDLGLANVIDKKDKTKNLFLEPDRAIMLKDIIDKLIDDNGKALYSLIGAEMRNKSADFIPKNYNAKSLKIFIDKALKEIGNYEIKNDGLTMYLVQKKK